MTKRIENELYKIAARQEYSIEKRGDLKKHYNGDEDYFEVSIASIECMLAEAYELGRKTAEEEAQEKADFKHQIFMNAYNHYYQTHPEERR